MDAIEEIENLKSLLDQGAITTEEFNELKKKVLSGVIDSSEPQNIPQLTSQHDINIVAKESKKESIDSIKPEDEVKTSTVNPDSRNVAKDDSSQKLEITTKEALKMLDKMDVGFLQQNLIHYSQVGDYKWTEILLIAGLSPNETWYNPEQKRNIYPLHNTAGWGTPKMVNLLLNYGADINLEDDFGLTALFYAIEYGTKAAAKVLIERGADINHKTKKNLNPLYYAKWKKKPEMTDLLLKAGAEELPADEIKSIDRKRTVKNIFLAAIVIGVIWLIGSVFFNPSSSDSSNPSSSSSSSSYEDNSSQQQVKKKECRYCKGTGTQVCNLCGGTGVNNMGIECGCIRTYKMEIMAGHTPSHEPLSWTCTFCKGTGESKY